jgi:hypothetical protein
VTGRSGPAVSVSRQQLRGADPNRLSRRKRRARKSTYYAKPPRLESGGAGLVSRQVALRGNAG